MSISIDRHDLRRGLETAKRFCDHRSAVPTLDTVLMAVGDGTVTLSATDMDTACAVWVPADTNGTRFSAAIKGARHMPRALRHTPGDAVLVDAAEDTAMPGPVVTITGDGAALSYEAFPGEDHPEHLGIDAMPMAHTAFRAHLDGTAVAALFQALDFACTEETRFYLNGVALQPDRRGGPWSYRICATDGHRMFMRSPPVPDATATAEWSDWVILPRRALTKLEPMLREALKSGEDVTLTLGNTAPRNAASPQATLTAPARRIDPSPIRLAEFATSRWTVRVKLIDGIFPLVDRVVPEVRPDRQVRFEVPALRAALRLLTAINPASRTCAAISLAVDGDRCTLARSVIGAGQGTVTVPCQTGTPNRKITVGVNVGYLSRALDRLGASESVVLQMDDADGAPIRLMSDDAPESLAVVMPMRV